MRLFALALVVSSFTACLRPAAQLETPARSSITISPTIPPLAGTVSCAAVDGGTTFLDGTENWNLGQLGLDVTGNRLTVADLDGDGYPDLVVHAVTSNLRENPDGGRKLVRQLMNRPAPVAGRRMFVEASDWGLFQAREDAAVKRSAQLAVFADVDNDGDLDAFSGTNVDPTRPQTDPGDRSEVLLNDGTGHFTLAPPSAPRFGATELWPTTAATFTDSDRDGKLDLFVGFFYERYGQTYQGLQAQLYRGTGTGEFVTATQGAGLTTDAIGFAQGTNHRPAYGVTACDLDDDGAPELLVSAYGRQANLLYQNDGLGRFTEVGVDAGFASDGVVDVSDNEFFRCWCTQYPSSPKCLGVSAPRVQCPTPNAGSNWNDGVDDQPWRNGGNTFTTWCGDIDGDGKNDLYSAEIRHWWAGESSDTSALLRNVSSGGALRFERPGNAATGLQIPRLGTSWNEGGLMATGGDLDNDGRLDLYVALSDYPFQWGLAYLQQPDGTFVESSDALGLRHTCASGLAFADFDRDGDLDVLVGSSTARDCSATWKKNEVHLYENQGPAGSAVTLRLVGDGTSTNRSAIGAKVTVKAGGRTVTRDVQGGYGHYGMQNDLVVHAGVGGCDGAEEVTVRWPDAARTTQTFRNVPAGAPVELRQGQPELFRVLAP